MGFKIRCGHTWINVCPNSEECTEGIPLNNKKSIKPSKDKHPLTKFYYIYLHSKKWHNRVMCVLSADFLLLRKT